MGDQQSLRVKVWGDYACYTRPENKVERLSYAVMTPSAARGILEAVYWKPEIRWRVTRIWVLRPIRFASIRRNEVGCKIPAKTAATAMKNGRGSLGVYVEEERQQRAASILRDVAYVIEAHFDIISGEDNIVKHLEQFRRRARDGRCYHRPYLGCREFSAQFELIEDSQALPEVHPDLRGERDLGYMLYDIDFDDSMKSHFFRAVLRDGVIDVPLLMSREEMVCQ